MFLGSTQLVNEYLCGWRSEDRSIERELTVSVSTVPPPPRVQSHRFDRLRLSLAFRANAFAKRGQAFLLSNCWHHLWFSSMEKSTWRWG